MANVPDERSLVREYKDKDFVLIGVNADAVPKGGLESLAKRTVDRKIDWRSFADGQAGPIVKAWGVTAFPTTYLIDGEGVIQGRDLHGEALRSEIDRLLAEKPK